MGGRRVSCTSSCLLHNIKTCQLGHFCRLRSSWRERQITELQERRLVLVKEMLIEREESRKELAAAKIERLRQKKKDERDRLFTQTSYRRIKVLRRMYTARLNATMPSSDRLGRTVARYVDRSSSVYAPLARHGNIPECNTAKIEVFLCLPRSSSQLPGSKFVISPQYLVDEGRWWTTMTQY